MLSVTFMLSLSPFLTTGVVAAVVVGGGGGYYISTLCINHNNYITMSKKITLPNIGLDVLILFICRHRATDA